MVTPAAKRRPIVEELERPLTIRRLRMLNLLLPGRRTQTRLENCGAVEDWICDLTTDQPFFAVSHSPHFIQFVSLVVRTVGREQRWFFCEGEQRVVCQKLYPFEGRYVSRKTAGLGYLSQLKSSPWRQSDQISTINADDHGSRGRCSATPLRERGLHVSLHGRPSDIRSVSVVLR